MSRQPTTVLKSKNCIPPAQMTVVSVKNTNWGQERQKKKKIAEAKPLAKDQYSNLCPLNLLEELCP